MMHSTAGRGQATSYHPPDFKTDDSETWLEAAFSLGRNEMY